ncbi:hypothetical protein C8R47DRAFT_1083910 [Mycena vitilis]|nr:hypothetical protein C8R47DRAFT_1083910 [Mycena vitilis]
MSCLPQTRRRQGQTPGVRGRSVGALPALESHCRATVPPSTFIIRITGRDGCIHGVEMRYCPTESSVAMPPQERGERPGVRTTTPEARNVTSQRDDRRRVAMTRGFGDGVQDRHCPNRGDDVIEGERRARGAAQSAQEAKREAFALAGNRRRTGRSTNGTREIEWDVLEDVRMVNRGDALPDEAGARSACADGGCDPGNECNVAAGYRVDRAYHTAIADALGPQPGTTGTIRCPDCYSARHRRTQDGSSSVKCMGRGRCDGDFADDDDCSGEKNTQLGVTGILPKGKDAERPIEGATRKAKMKDR